MSSIANGLSGLMLGYAAVAVPMAATMIRRGADFGRVLKSAATAVPLTVVAGIGTAMIDPLLHVAGIGQGSFLELMFGIATTVAVGYAAGRYFARPTAAPKSVYQRGTIIDGPEAGLSASAHSASRSSWFSWSASRERANAYVPAQPHDEAQPSEPTHQQRPASQHGQDGYHGQTSRQGRAMHYTQSDQFITLAGIPVAPLDETKHFKLIGTTGTGKSTAIRELLTGALQRGDRAIIADPDGGYMARFKDSARGDIVLNPFEPESRKWDLFGEINNPYDIDQLARSLLPDQGGPDRSWVGYARTFFTSVTRQAHEAGVTDIRELYDLLVVTDTKELRSLLTGTPAQPFLEEHNGRMFDSIRSVTSSAVASLDYISQQTSSPLSIRQWVREGRSAPTSSTAGAGANSAPGPSGGDSRGGVLFIPYKAGQIAALHSTISAWMRLAIFESMSQPEGDQRLWFVVDELDALGQIDGLKDALARLRKFGGRCVLGFQSIAQVSSTYGNGDAQTIVENCGNTLILRCSGSEHGGTAGFASRLIGQREVLRTQRSRSRRPNEFLSSITLSEHVGIEPAVMPSQIEQLPDLSGYLKFASRPNWQRVTLAAPNSSMNSDNTRANDSATDSPIWRAIRAEAHKLWQEWRSRSRAAGDPTPEPSARDHQAGAREAPQPRSATPPDSAEYP